MTLYSELNNRNSPLVQVALTRRCQICKAKPGEDCDNMPINHHRLEGRIVHYARTCE